MSSRLSTFLPFLPFQKVRLSKAPGDPMVRHAVPICSDKAFFCSSRVRELTEWDFTTNLDWEVVVGAHGDPTRDGGRQRLVAKVRRSEKKALCMA